MKTYPPVIEQMLSEGRVKFAHSILFYFDTPLAFSDGGTDLYDGIDDQVYVMDGSFKGMDEITKRADLTISELTMSFDMSNQILQSIIFNQKYKGVKVKIQRFFFDDDGVTQHIEVLWNGSITKYADDDNEAVANLTVKNVFADFSTKNSWRTTLQSHHRRFPDDMCFKYAAKASETIYWAGTASGSKNNNGSSVRASSKGITRIK